METPSYIGPPPIEPKGGSLSFDYHIASLLWGLITFGVSFYYGRQEHLWLTPWLIWLPGALAILFIWKKRLHSLKDQAIILFLSTLAMMAIPYLETELLRRDPPPMQEAFPAVEEVSFELLEGVSFSGFRTKTTGQRSFVLLTIDEIERQPYRIVFRYSLNEGLVRYRGQGVIYPLTFTLHLADGTILRYQKENGIIKFLAQNHTGYELSQTSQK